MCDRTVKIIVEFLDWPIDIELRFPRAGSRNERDGDVGTIMTTLRRRSVFISKVAPPMSKRRRFGFRIYSWTDARKRTFLTESIAYERLVSFLRRAEPRDQKIRSKGR